MNLFNKITTTTALAIMLIASAPMAHAMDQDITEEEMVARAIALSLQDAEERKESNTSPDVTTPKIQLVEEPKNTTSSFSNTTSNPEQGAEALMSLLNHFLPKVQEILQETPIQQEGTQTNLKNIFSAEQKQSFANLAQEVLNDERTTRTIKLVLPNVEPSNVTGGLFRGLSTSAEKKNNASYAWYTGGGSVHNRNLATYANKGTPHAQLLLDKAVEELAEGKPYLCNTLLAQAKDFSGLKEKLEATVEKHNLSKK